MPVLTGESIKDLSDSLAYLRKLDYLKLDFDLCDNLTDDNLKILSSGFKYMTELKDLHIIWGNGKNFTNTGLKDFCLCFHGLQKIENFTFGLREMPCVTDEGLKLIATNIIKMLSLTTLKLDL